MMYNANRMDFSGCDSFMYCFNLGIWFFVHFKFEGENIMKNKRIVASLVAALSSFASSMAVGNGGNVKTISKGGASKY